MKNDLDLDKFETKLGSRKASKEQLLYEKVLAAAVAADRRGFFVEPQTVMDQDETLVREELDIVWGSTKFQKSISDRGIRTTSDPNLSLRQETFLQAYLNPLNLKPPQTIAKQLKISTTELDGWMRDKHFGGAMSSKSEDNLKKYLPLADQALGQLVQQGDMKAITFINQLTGRFDPNARQSLDVPALMMQIQDIVLRNVRDPIVKRNIARELVALAQGHSPLTSIPEPNSDTIDVETAIEIRPKEG
tara:strand:+ start:405 stop:1145 length:741 start_codon:yes stop_codon:yes gene_type:complete